MFDVQSSAPAPNHWHLLLWPRRDGELGAFMQAVTATHVCRWRLNRRTVGEGHLYHGTYESFKLLGLESTFRPRGRPKTKAS